MEAEDKIKGLLTAIGAIAEVLQMYRESLLNAGFTRDEAFKLCRDLERTIFETAICGGISNED